jgi:hypothetical protein
MLKLVQHDMIEYELVSSDLIGGQTIGSAYFRQTYCCVFYHFSLPHAVRRNIRRTKCFNRLGKGALSRAPLPFVCLFSRRRNGVGRCSPNLIFVGYLLRGRIDYRRFISGEFMSLFEVHSGAYEGNCQSCQGYRDPFFETALLVH